MTNHRLLSTLIADFEQRIDDTVDPAMLGALPIGGIAYRSDAAQAGDLFFCVPGSRADGHDFAPDAAARGAVALAVEHPVSVELPQIRFEDTRLALARVSQAFYGDPSKNLTITAVTGTNGKTTTTYLIDWISRLALARRLLMENAAAAADVGAAANAGVGVGAAANADVGAAAGVNAAARTATDAAAYTGLIGTVETRIGTSRLPSKFTTPESLDLQRLLAQMLKAGVSHVCMEVSSHAIALHRVAGISFAVAAFSNLTQDHLDFHGSMEAYFETKASLFLSPLVAARTIDVDTEYGQRLARRCKEAGFSALTCGFSPNAQVRAEAVDYYPERTVVTITTPEGRFSVEYPLIGRFNVSNVLLAASAASLLGFSWEEITDALALCPQVPGRLERVCAQGIALDDERQPPIKVFVDYSHTPDSIEKALEAIREIKGTATATRAGASKAAPAETSATAQTLIVFGCGGDRDATKRPLMGAAALAADYAIVTSDNPRTEAPLAIIADILPGMKGAEGHYEVEPDRRAAIARALRKAASGDFVLIAGKGHEDYQLVGDAVLDFDDRLVAAEELRRLAETGHRPQQQQPPSRKPSLRKLPSRKSSSHKDGESCD
ncbi:MAG: UDP-N-acetylmuramoyl-L-alanyl-D-glutamate--2,6-diaminopimelate ligase [Coriobacteriales bacterium]|jgi:UDP-N-acetylmuramoyl-L-alanyl-D-glutamate--2,6-diaminopimelate ligase|nr:UDP-N-acetylmuramoyl-L-alanyl-D-glutamate--2,6-diaminopimelate ligase [Coriobacteriales bacterium]